MSFVSQKSNWVNDFTEGDEQKTKDLEFSPQVGFFLFNGFAIGTEFLMMYYSEEDESEGNKYSSNSLILAPFARYYFGKSMIKPYLSAEIGFGYIKAKYDPNFGMTTKTKSKVSLYDLGGGLGIFINQKVMIDIGIDYSDLKAIPQKDNTTNLRNISSGWGIGVGLNIILSGASKDVETD